MLQLIDDWRTHDPSVEILVVTRSPTGFLQPELDRRQIPWMMLQFESWVLPKLIVEPEDVYRTARHDFVAVKALIRLIREFQPDVVVTNTIVAPWAAVAAKTVGVPHVWFPREFGDDHEFSVGVDSTFEDIGLLSDLVVTNSRTLADYLSRWVSDDKITVLYPFPDLSNLGERAHEQVDGWRSPFSGDTTALRVVCVGRIAESKGQTRLIRAVARLKASGIRIEAALVGNASGPEGQRVESLVRELDVDDRVFLTGELANPFLVIEAADVGVVVSDSEGFGRVTVEYMASGKPVVAARAGATVELVADGETGLLFEPGDEDALVETLRCYWNDRELIATHGTAARASVFSDIAERYPLSRVLDRIEATVAEGSAPVARMPHLMLSWMSLPRTAQQMFANAGALANPASSATWRVGNLVAKPLRFGTRLGKQIGTRLGRVPRQIGRRVLKRRSA